MYYHVAPWYYVPRTRYYVHVYKYVCASVYMYFVRVHSNYIVHKYIVIRTSYIYAPVWHKGASAFMIMCARACAFVRVRACMCARVRVRTV